MISCRWSAVSGDVLVPFLVPFCVSRTINLCGRISSWSHWWIQEAWQTRGKNTCLPFPSPKLTTVYMVGKGNCKLAWAKQNFCPPKPSGSIPPPTGVEYVKSAICRANINKHALHVRFYAYRRCWRRDNLPMFVFFMIISHRTYVRTVCSLSHNTHTSER